MEKNYMDMTEDDFRLLLDADLEERNKFEENIVYALERMNRTLERQTFNNPILTLLEKMCVKLDDTNTLLEGIGAMLLAQGEK